MYCAALRQDNAREENIDATLRLLHSLFDRGARPRGNIDLFLEIRGALGTLFDLSTRPRRTPVAKGGSVHDLIEKMACHSPAKMQDAIHESVKYALSHSTGHTIFDQITAAADYSPNMRHCLMGLYNRRDEATNRLREYSTSELADGLGRR